MSVNSKQTVIGGSRLKKTPAAIDSGIDNMTVDQLERQLGGLAARWRGTDEQRAAASIVKNYQSTLRRMIALGYHDSLDVESELPDEYMPAEYLALFA